MWSLWSKLRYIHTIFANLQTIVVPNNYRSSGGKLCKNTVEH